MQISLLRLIENCEFSRIGSQKSTSVDVRVIAASNADLVDEVRRGKFRQDLYYRLDVFHITIRVDTSIEKVEKELIARTLDHTGHNRTRTSEILGISRRSLFNKIQRYDL